MENRGILKHQTKTMKKPSTHINLLTCVFISAIFCLLAVPYARSSEPGYNGKPLSEWLLILKMGHTSTGDPIEKADAKEAIRQMGTNAIPTLLDILGATDGNKRRILARLKSPGFREVFQNQNVGTGDLEDMGVQGFGILGTNAVSAIPKINKMFRHSAHSAAAQALVELGTEGFAALTNGMSDKDLAGEVVWTLGHGGGGDAVTRILISALNNPERATRGNAARFLAGRDPALVIPALISLLDDKEYYPRDGATITLGSFGPAAKIAVPKLFALCTNYPTSSLLHALRDIDPTTAAKAEAFIVNGGPLGAAGDGWSETTLPNGWEFRTGGFLQTTIPTNALHVFSRAWLVDPPMMKWAEAGSMNVARWDHLAILLGNGKVLVAGGLDAKNKRLSSAELYDPATGKWAMTGSMNAPHSGGDLPLQQIQQHKGKVLIGNWGELYDSATGIWTVVTNK